MQISGVGLESKPEENRMSNGNGSTGPVGEQAHGIEDQAHGATNGDTQESYFANTSFRGVCIRGAKKAITECSSIKSLALAGVFGLMAFTKLDAMWGIIGILGLVGAREIDFNQIIQVFQGRIGGGSR
jgi:hypothetical protein